MKKLAMLVLVLALVATTVAFGETAELPSQAAHTPRAEVVASLPELPSRAETPAHNPVPSRPAHNPAFTAEDALQLVRILTGDGEAHLTHEGQHTYVDTSSRRFLEVTPTSTPLDVVQWALRWDLILR